MRSRNGMNKIIRAIRDQNEGGLKGPNVYNILGDLYKGTLGEMIHPSLDE